MAPNLPVLIAQHQTHSKEAWNKLLHPSAAILVDKESLDRINRTSVELQDGSGYMAALDVYHQLHCLISHRDGCVDTFTKTTTIPRRKIWANTLVSPVTIDFMQANFFKDHCLDGLRQYVMCNADLSINTFDWIPNYPKPWPNFEVVHKCANWESIEEWVLANSFNGFDPNLIRHPDYHPELPSPFNYTVSGNSP
ncbi:hypothetical protein N7491_004916 [Penicillium cf. griseofulvum]|uniref:Uncharacterized protein n=1 Tax=Penicillium cf. griseofulvum TaxID=2972120 RepID=A0A9W9J2F6_9EURO|nr:hypothetical protein N7472_007611 [Penicillium cf. griseofulvum]KAJ5434321.1 hypothetical protein N7491_004916 [Penicillium cf. griseofulvum]KAJ5452153.1 hypothetical protein N7445_000336 [Penicillium cf. griseofulvum]